MPDLAYWLELHAMRLRQGFRGEAAYPLPPLAFSPPERELFQLAERLTEALRPVEPRPVWVASLYERLMEEARPPRCFPAPSRPSRWWLGVVLGTAALGVWAYRRLHATRH
ncbi:hypothetical protein HRbin22_01844 [Candidatus Thermoflexus japonica]|uniref:Uncharacterized protein n=1 Tax=Candidatus Thermoflexus japonica TaxID=2035417 RepID=A0A2H5Y825_9CHLR|nr:hypothetical protein HRbin22_01844 [Candidatus Thermoflexus japonica]